jgi:hypothetical protein
MCRSKLRAALMPALLVAMILSSCSLAPRMANKVGLKPMKEYPARQQLAFRRIQVYMVLFFGGFIYLYGIRK